MDDIKTLLKRIIGIIDDHSSRIRKLEVRLPINPNAFPNHHERHQTGGFDEIVVTDLSGLLADPQTPLDHDHSGDVGDGGQFEVLNLITTETDTEMRLAPDGVGGIGWVAGGGTAEVSEGPGIDVVDATVGIGGDTILLYHADGSPVSEFAATDAGLDAASTAAVAGDRVTLPEGAVFSSAHTLTGSVTYQGLNLNKTLFSNEVVLGDGTLLENIRLRRTLNTESISSGIVGPSSGSAFVRNVDVLLENSSSGPTYALEVGTGNVYATQSLFKATGVGSYGLYISGTVTLEEYNTWYSYEMTGAHVESYTTGTAQPGRVLSPGCDCGNADDAAQLYNSQVVYDLGQDYETNHLLVRCRIGGEGYIYISPNGSDWSQILATQGPWVYAECVTNSFTFSTRIVRYIKVVNVNIPVVGGTIYLGWWNLEGSTMAYGGAYMRDCTMNGGAYDISSYTGVETLVHMYSCDYSSINVPYESYFGDRSAWDIDNAENFHASDIYANKGIRHLPDADADTPYLYAVDGEWKAGTAEQAGLAPAGGAGHTIYDDWVAVTPRVALDVIGPLLGVADNGTHLSSELSFLGTFDNGIQLDGTVIELITDKILLAKADGSGLDVYDADDTGFDAAQTAAAAGDWIKSPLNLALSSAHTLKDYINYDLYGATITAKITLANACNLYNAVIAVTANDANDLIALEGPRAGLSAGLHHVHATATQSGSGNGYGFKSGGGDTIVDADCWFEGSTADKVASTAVDTAGTTLKTGGITISAENGNEITGFVVGKYYSIEATGQWDKSFPLGPTSRAFQLSLDRVTWDGAMGMHFYSSWQFTKPSWCYSIYDVDGNHVRTHFQATQTSYYMRTYDDSGWDAHNYGTFGYIVKEVTYADGTEHIDLRGFAPFHASNHEDGGPDELSVAGLSGLLADPQNVLDHVHDGTAGSGGTIDVLDLTTTEMDTSKVLKPDGTGKLAYGTGGTGGGSQSVIFTIAGNVGLVSGAIRIYNVTGGSKTIAKVFMSASTAPTGAAIIADIHKDGTTIFTNQANRPQIADSAQTGVTTTVDVSAWADGEYLTLDIDQIGSTISGANLTVHVVYS